MSVRPTMVDRAANHFAQLRAFDSAASERAELVAAGVPSHTREALLGSEFDGIAQGLCNRFESLGLFHVVAARTWEPVNAYVRNLNRTGGRERLTVLEAQLHASELNGGLRVLTDCLLDITSGLTEGHNSAKIARAIWYAHWYMTRRATLSPNAAVAADCTMNWVHENLLTPSA
jgi:hypothetical protein